MHQGRRKKGRNIVALKQSLEDVRKFHSAILDAHGSWLCLLGLSNISCSSVLSESKTSFRRGQSLMSDMKPDES